jgi:hypothetical protein
MVARSGKIIETSCEASDSESSSRNAEMIQGRFPASSALGLSKRAIRCIECTKGIVKLDPEVKSTECHFHENDTYQMMNQHFLHVFNIVECPSLLDVCHFSKRTAK